MKPKLQGHLGYGVFNCLVSAAREGTLEGSGVAPALACLLCLHALQASSSRAHDLLTDAPETIANIKLKGSSSYAHWYCSQSPRAQVTLELYLHCPLGL